jgi:hypothetical protein
VDFIEAIRQLGWRSIAIAVLISLVITAACSIAFYVGRLLVLDRKAKILALPKVASLYVSFGTELFALLFAVDLCVIAGFVEIWRLRDIPMAERVFRTSAVLFAFLTAYCCWLALVYERQSYAAWLRFKGYANPAQVCGPAPSHCPTMPAGGLRPAWYGDSSVQFISRASSNSQGSSR